MDININEVGKPPSVEEDTDWKEELPGEKMNLMQKHPFQMERLINLMQNKYMKKIILTLYNAIGKTTSRKD